MHNVQIKIGNRKPMGRTNNGHAGLPPTRNNWTDYAKTNTTKQKDQRVLNAV